MPEVRAARRLRLAGEVVEAAYSREVLDRLSPHFLIKEQVDGRHCTGRLLRIGVLTELRHRGLAIVAQGHHVLWDETNGVRIGSRWSVAPRCGSR